MYCSISPPNAFFLASIEHNSFPLHSFDMPPLTADPQASPKNGHLPILDDKGGNGHSNGLDVVEEFQGLGFRFLRSFLLLILLLVGFMIALTGFLSWYFSMDVTVEGKGVIEPKYRCLVKTAISGIIKEIHVRSGQQVKSGDLLVSLDDTDWSAELQKIDTDLEINQSRIRELEKQIDQERKLREAEVAQAQLEVNRVLIQMEQVVAEQQIYSQVGNPNTRLPRKPLEELLPVRVANALLTQSEGYLTLARQRLEAVDGRRQEIQILGKLREKLEQDRALLEYRLERNTIRAPATGTVLTSDLRQRIGDRLQAGEVTLEIAKMEKWQARILVKGMDLPKIDVGQPARLYVDAFPHMEYKIFEGKVEEIPAAGISTGNGTGYPVKVFIHDPEVVDGEHIYALADGMSVEAKIVIDRGKIIELLWRRLLQASGKIGKHNFYILKSEEIKMEPLNTSLIVLDYEGEYT